MGGGWTWYGSTSGLTDRIGITSPGPQANTVFIPVWKMCLKDKYEIYNLIHPQSLERRASYVQLGIGKGGRCLIFDCPDNKF